MFKKTKWNNTKTMSKCVFWHIGSGFLFDGRQVLYTMHKYIANIYIYIHRKGTHTNAHHNGLISFAFARTHLHLAKHRTTALHPFIYLQHEMEHGKVWRTHTLLKLAYSHWEYRFLSLDFVSHAHLCFVPCLTLLSISNFNGTFYDRCQLRGKIQTISSLFFSHHKVLTSNWTTWLDFDWHFFLRNAEVIADFFSTGS